VMRMEASFADCSGRAISIGGTSVAGRHGDCQILSILRLFG
jgi:hypothetical protein